MSTDGVLVVDTDCGSDDAMALAMALGGERADRLIALTSCFGNTTSDNARDNARRVLMACGRTEIPVYRGSEHPIARDRPDPRVVLSSVAVHGADGFGGCGRLFPLEVPEEEEEEEAAEALVRMARDRPGEITLVALAPLTNVALAHRRDPGFTGRLKEIVCLGGNYTGVGNVTEAAEFNFFSDPEAAHTVLRESLCPIRMVPWETCLENGMEWEDFRAMLRCPGKKAELLRGATSTVARFCEEEGDPAFLDCDVLAVAAALWPECVAATKVMEEGAMGVDCGEGPTRGTCIIGKSAAEGRARVELVQRFHGDMLKELREAMVVERPLKKEG